MLWGKKILFGSAGIPKSTKSLLYVDQLVILEPLIMFGPINISAATNWHHKSQSECWRLLGLFFLYLRWTKFLSFNFFRDQLKINVGLQPSLGGITHFIENHFVESLFVEVIRSKNKWLIILSNLGWVGLGKGRLG